VPIASQSRIFNILSDEDGSVVYNWCWPRQRSHSRIRGLRDSWPYFTVSDSRHPQPGWQGPHIYVPQEQGGPVTPPGTGFPFRHLLRLTGLRRRYSNPLPRGVTCFIVRFSFYCRQCPL
jgi:hypothetical protein